MLGEASLSQELPTPGLLQAQVLVGYSWQNIRLGPVDSVPTATEATSCRNFPNRAGYFHSTRLSRDVAPPVLGLSPCGSRLHRTREVLSTFPCGPSPCPGHYPWHLTTTTTLLPCESPRLGNPIVSRLR
jgi:hypothetical protein